MRYKIIAYSTKDPYYMGLSENFVESCKLFNLPYHLEIIDSLGDWCLNTHWKAKFIRNCMYNIESDYLIYTDVDARFKRYPDLIENIECDIAYRTQDFRWRSDEALSGTIFLRNNDKVKRFVDRWIELNESVPAERMKPETWEQKNMQRAHREMSDLVYYNLPPEYTFIYDHMKTMYPGVKPVIEHYQESRNVHKKMNQNSNFRIRR